MNNAHPLSTDGVKESYRILKTSRRQKLLDLLEDNQWHHWQQCQRAGGMRYGARLHELKQDGYVIEDKLSDGEDGGKYYRLTGLSEIIKHRKVRIYLPAKRVEELLVILENTNQLDGLTRRATYDTIQAALDRYYGKKNLA